MEEFSNISPLFLFSYGEGEFKRDTQYYRGQIILSEHKLYLKDQRGELSATFIPLERIFRITVGWDKIIIDVRPSTFMKFRAEIKGKPSQIRSLARDIAQRRQMKKSFFGLKWVDPEMM